ncbi:MAG: hypothetical protein NT155_01085 [Candidatus Staskawiczbacteria bacterium]|nr:hypothetical protein [Candidatus Staskawiczbacteria bacterium]
MSNLLLKKYKFIFLFLLTGVFGFIIPLQTHAYLAPGIFVTDLKINSVENSEIKGEFSILNSEKYYLSDLNYVIKLFQGTEFYKLQLIDLQVPKETFFIPPYEKITKSFDYKYPENILSGDYTLRLQAVNGRGGELGWKDQIISLEGQNQFLKILPDSTNVVVNGKNFFPLEGVNVGSKEKVTASFQLKNLADKITATPQVKIFQRQFNMPVVKEYQDSPISFEKGETKTVELQMPNFDNPESYLAEIKFFSNQQQISGTQYFRWVVKGQGGKILYMKADKDYFKAGENISLIVESIGPADLSDLGQGTLEASVSDKYGNYVGKASRNVSLNSGLVASQMVIPVTKDLISPEIDLKLIKDGQTLDERKINLPVFSKEAKQIEETQEKSKGAFNRYLFYLIIAICLIIILAGAFFVYKIKIAKPKK